MLHHRYRLMQDVAVVKKMQPLRDAEEGKIEDSVNAQKAVEADTGPSVGNNVDIQA